METHERPGGGLRFRFALPAYPSFAGGGEPFAANGHAVPGKGSAG